MENTLNGYIFRLRIKLKTLARAHTSKLQKNGTNEKEEIGIKKNNSNTQNIYNT